MRCFQFDLIKVFERIFNWYAEAFKTTLNVNKSVDSFALKGVSIENRFNKNVLNAYCAMFNSLNCIGNDRSES